MSTLASSVGKPFLERTLQSHGPQDPLYETYIDKRGRQRRRERETPPGLSIRDAKILKSVQRRAHYLDKGFHICGVRFGWTFIIGIIPGVGDAADAVLNYVLVVRKARQAEIPKWLFSRMLFNNAVSTGIGSVPIVGDIALAMWMANWRNAALFEEYLRVRGEECLKAAAGRTEEPGTVRPGAGCNPDEVVPGKKPERSETGTSSATGWFRRGITKSKENKQKAVPSSSSSVPSPERGRFIENITSATPAVHSKRRCPTRDSLEQDVGRLV